MAHPPAWIDITAEDAERSRSFYRGLLGWEIHVEESTNYGLVQPTSEGLPGGIGQTSDESAHPGRVVVYFTVDDLDAALERAKVSAPRASCPRGNCPGSAGWQSSVTPTATASDCGSAENSRSIETAAHPDARGGARLPLAES